MHKDKIEYIYDISDYRLQCTFCNKIATKYLIKKNNNNLFCNIACSDLYNNMDKYIIDLKHNANELEHELTRINNIIEEWKETEFKKWKK